uniref:RimK family alpha-L-glutamate ligase n=1 Tax=Schlesneria paludicola TaxID=360056 RepID=A0A7C4QR13_9PLAN
MMAARWGCMIWRRRGLGTRGGGGGALDRPWADDDMRIGILAQPESWYYRDLERAAQALGHACERWDFPQLSGGVVQQRELLAAHSAPDKPPWETLPPDVLVVRTMPPGSLEQVIIRMDLLSRWEAHGTRVVNSPKSLECAIDKYLTTARLAAAGLPVPDTVVCETAEQAEAAFEQLGGDVVVKPLFGGEGRGIVRVSDPDLAHRVFHTLERIHAVFYLQRFIDHGGSDLRLLVLDGRILGGMKRFARGGFRTNVAQAGHAEPHVPTDRECELAWRAAAATGVYFAGIDLLWDRDGRLYVIEVNAVPGWKAFGRVNRLDVAHVFLGTLARR